MKYAFAGNRDIAVWVLEFLVSKGYYPELLMLTETSDLEIEELVTKSQLDSNKIFYGKPEFNGVIEELKKSNIDYIFGVHYPYIISKEVLNIPKFGFLNLHPAFLPYNRGWHTPSWAILENTPVGATLHYMNEKLDMGAIVKREQLEILVSDTADSLYKKLKQLEYDVFVNSFDCLLNHCVEPIIQDENEGSIHLKNDLYKDDNCKLELDDMYKCDSLITRLRALTTNNINEASYFIKNGRKYRVQIIIEEEFPSI